MTRTDFWGLIKATYTEWSDDQAPRLGAALAFYTVFSLAPLLVVIIAVVGFVWANQADPVQSQIVDQMHELLGPDGARVVQTMLEATGERASGGLIATALGVAALLFGATGVFAQLQNALNTIWDVKPKPDLGLLGLIRVRLLSFGMVFAVGFLLLVSLIVAALLAALDEVLTGLAPGTYLLMNLLNLAVSVGVITLLFAMIYRVLPDVEIAWSDVWIGALITALLFTAGKWAIGVYLGNSSVASTYGAAGSLAILLLWIYYSAQIIFFGAEFTQVYARHRGAHIRPSAHAVPVDEPSPLALPERASCPSLLKQEAPVSAEKPSTFKRFVLLGLAFLAGRFFGRHR